MHCRSYPHVRPREKMSVHIHSPSGWAHSSFSGGTGRRGPYLGSYRTVCPCLDASRQSLGCILFLLSSRMGRTESIRVFWHGGCLFALAGEVLTAVLEVPGPGWLDVGPHSAPTDVIPSSAGSYGRNASYLVDVDLVQQDTSTPKTLYSHTSLGHCAAEPPHTFCCRLHSTLPADQHTGPRY